MTSSNRAGVLALLYHAVGAGLLAGLFSAYMWAAEPWQRPLKLLWVEEGAWLAVAIIGFAIGTAAWPGHARRLWALRVAICVALCIVMPLSFLHLQRPATVEMLLDHDQVMRVTTPGFSRPERTPNWWDHLKSGFEREVLPKLGISPPSSGTGLIVTHYPDPYDHLLETCRWPTRRAFIEKIIDDPMRVRLATYDWHRLFPAVVGQDVTLARRAELLDWLDGISSDESKPVVCRDAARFWMALVILTDVEAFGDWVDQVTAAMLQSRDPPMSRTGDVWMRVLDLLIALNPEQEHAMLAAPLTGDATLLRRALRQRVRGMQHHVDVIVKEIEMLDASGDRQSAGAMWADLNRLANMMDDEGKRADIHTSLSGFMGRWLLEESKVAMGYCKNLQSGFPDFWPHGFASLPSWSFRMPEHDQTGLVEKAHAAIDKLAADDFPVLANNLDFHHAFVIAGIVGEEHRISIHNRAASLIIQSIPKLTDSVDYERERVVVISELAKALEIVMEDLEEEILEHLKETLLEWALFREDLYKNTRHLWRTAVVVDMKSREPSLTTSERIALWQLGDAWRDLFPQYSADEVREFFDMLASDDAPARFDLAFTTVRRQRNVRILVHDYLRYRALLHGMVGLPERDLGNAVFAHEHGIVGLARRGPYSQAWEASDDEPFIVGKILEGINLESYANYHVFMEFLKDHPLLPETREVILDYLMRHLDSQYMNEATTAFHWLMHFSDWLDEERLGSFRSRFRRFFREERPNIDSWQSRYIHYNVVNFGCGTMHRGEQIPWKDDALSAEFSWSSSIHHDLATLPWRCYQEPSVFRHIHASGCYFQPPGWDPSLLDAIPMNHIASEHAFEDGVPCPRVSITPWERARSLHLRRPDLKFPDRPIFRPTGKRVHLRKYQSHLDP